jgi:hypothetical protein
MHRLRPVDPIDLVALIGLAALALGVALVYYPAAFIVVGGLLLLYAVMASRGTP